MTLSETVLQRLGSWHPPRNERQALVVAEEGNGWAVSLTADRNDDLSCVLWELVLRRASTLSAADALVRAWADKVAGRATGLLEPLQVVEIDDQRNEALVRSKEPTRRGSERFYYEFRLTSNRQAVVRRFRASEDGGQREQIAYALTHEALAKLIEDLVAD